MEPFRAFVADNLNEKQRSYGYAMQSMFIGGASFIAGFLPTLLVDWFGITRQKINGGIPANIVWSFYIGAFVFLIAVMYTVFKSKEYPPVQQEEATDLDSNIVAEIVSSIKNMPAQMKRLALVQFLTWPGLFLMWFYYSTGVAVNIFGGDASAPEGSEALLHYSQGLEFANTTSAILNLVTFLFSFSIPFIVSKLGKRNTHAICLIIGGLGLVSVNFISESSLLYLSMSMVGIAWASILSMPYTILAGSIPPKKMGIYMGIFNFFIVLPEIIASLSFGSVMEHVLHNDRLIAVLIGGCLLITAAVLCLVLVKEENNTEVHE
jgi:maltose/moltooligosaccharide transporter